jgi:replicative DNA helicase
LNNKKLLAVLLSSKYDKDSKVIALNYLLSIDFTSKLLHTYSQENKQFYTNEYSLAFDVVIDYYNVYNDVPTTAAVLEEIRKKNLDNGLLNKIAVLLESIILVEQIDNIRYVVNEIKSEYLKHKQHQIYSEALNSNDPAQAITSAINELSLAITSVKEADRPEELTKGISEFLDLNWKDLLDREVADNGVSYGIDGLDKNVDLMQPGDLVTIVGTPGTGKSLLALHIAIQNTFYMGKRGVIANKEMTDRQTFVRILAMLTGIPSKKFKNRERLSADEIDCVTNGIKEYKTQADGKLHILPPQRSNTVTSIRREIKAIFGDDYPDYIIVDYLDELDCEIPGLQGHEKIAYITQRLKNLATEFNCPVITPTQPNADGFDAVKPTQSDVGYKSIAKKSDTILFLVQDKENKYIEPISDVLPGTPGIILAYVVKNRNGTQCAEPIRISVEYATASLSDANADVLDITEYIV